MLLTARQRYPLYIFAVTPVLLVAAYLRLHLLAEVPIGWHHDEATNPLMALDAIRALPKLIVFFPAYTGHEPLYVYMNMLAIVLFGRTVFSVRLVSAFVGILTVACTYQLGRRMFNRRVAWLAAGFLAVSVWHIITSRNGYRAVTQPLIQLPALIFLWRGLNSGRYRDYALAGAFVGAAQYTYLAARLFPLLLLLCGGVVLVVRRRHLWRELKRWVVMAFGALIVFAPLGSYFALNPSVLFSRTRQVSIFNPATGSSDALKTLLNNMRDAALMFSHRGDVDFRFNLGGRPVFAAPEAVLFWLGLVISLAGIVRSKDRQRLAYILLWLWLVVMLLPMVLSGQGIPNFLRAVGIVPAVFFLPAIALNWLIELAPEALSSRLRWRQGGSGVLVAGLLMLAMGAGREYFVDWAESVAGYDFRNLKIVQVAEYINARVPDESIYVSATFSQDPVVAWLAPGQFNRVHWFNASQTMVYPPAGEAAEYLFTDHEAANNHLLQLATDLEPSGEIVDPFGRVAITRYQWFADAQPPEPEISGPFYWSTATSYPEQIDQEEGEGILRPLSGAVDVGQSVAFLGYDLAGEDITAGEELRLLLYWRVVDVPDHQASVFAHLIDTSGNLIVGYDAGHFQPHLWSVGQTFVTYHPLRTASTINSGNYFLQFGMYNPDSGQRLIVYDEAGMPVDERILVGPVMIGAP